MGNFVYSYLSGKHKHGDHVKYHACQIKGLTGMKFAFQVTAWNSRGEQNEKKNLVYRRQSLGTVLGWASRPDTPDANGADLQTVTMDLTTFVSTKVSSERPKRRALNWKILSLHTKPEYFRKDLWIRMWSTRPLDPGKLPSLLAGFRQETPAWISPSEICWRRSNVESASNFQSFCGLQTGEHKILGLRWEGLVKWHLGTEDPASLVLRPTLVEETELEVGEGEERLTDRVKITPFSQIPLSTWLHPLQFSC